MARYDKCNFEIFSPNPYRIYFKRTETKRGINLIIYTRKEKDGTRGRI